MFNYSKGNLVRLPHANYSNSNYFLTDIQVPSHPLQGRRSPASVCIYGFWIAYMRNNRSDSFQLMTYFL